jgi:para-aminobenzoate synthetase component 1
MNNKTGKPLQPWYWQSYPLQQRTGSDIFQQLFLNDEISVLLESPYPPGEQPNLARYSICAGSPRQIAGESQHWTPPVGEILSFLNSRLQSSPQLPNSPPLPFTGGWLGWLGYDFAWEIEQLPTLKDDPLPFPVAFWYEPANFAVLDHLTQTLWLAASSPEDLTQLHDKLNAPTPLPLQPPNHLHNLQFLSTQAEYETAVHKAKEYIAAGDIFQANLSVRFQAQINASPWQIYRTLQEINPSPFANYWQTPWGSVISCSPERLIQLDNHQAQTRPIAGTRPRGATPQADQQYASDLLESAKDSSEHIMLVDLERNDLGRVCTWGSVMVDELLTIERYSHVMHLVSNVRGYLDPKYNAVDLIRALFPGGTITGCPKVRCLEIIEELEPVRRSLFYGSCGYLDWRGHLDLNILIRTLLYQHQSPQQAIVWGQVGAGIVADSDPEAEWDESLDKAKAQFAALK